MMVGDVRLCSLVVFLMVLCDHASARKVYIVQMKGTSKPMPFNTQADWYTSSLSSIVPDATESLLYVYDTAYQGYAISLEPEQAEALGKLDNVLGIYEDAPLKLHTTRTPYFLNVEDEFGLWGASGNISQGMLGDHNFHDVIIGILDTGITPESKSFDDTGFPEVPKRWKGRCEMGPDFDPFLCNKKLIGARTFSKGYRRRNEGNITVVLTPRDHDGHGTHTASTAAGSPVSNVTFLGKVFGTARGMAPHARVASYKVCWDGCYDSDILAGMDQAIKDGVDIMSLSLGGKDRSYYTSAVAVGAFVAMEKGIFVSASAGNDGPKPMTVSNGAPWIMTVGASTMDRDFPAYVFLGSGQELLGSSKYTGAGMDKPVNLVYNKGTNGSNLCLAGTLDPIAVKGKVVLCDRGENGRVEKGVVVRDAGGIGMILANTPEIGGELVLSDPFLLPAVMVGSSAGNIIRQYVLSDHNPTVQIPSTSYRLNVRPTPMVAEFSSRGPYTPSIQILKPDVIGPGVDVLAAWAKDAPPTDFPFDKRKVKFNMISGTSMSCPHITGLVALLKVAHPEWSASAIKSALITTSYVHDNIRKPIIDRADNSAAGPWILGAGHINPRRALSPGLVYNLTRDDYVAFICSLNYTAKQVQIVVNDPSVNCSRKFADPGELNYPSFTIIMSENRKTVHYTRELTNVGEPGSTYRVAIVAPPSVAVKVKPSRLTFGSLGDKKRYTVTFSANDTNINGKYGSITWINKEHRVRSPMIFMWT